MNLPKTLRLLGKCWTVEHGKFKRPGFCSPDKLLIQVDRRQASDAKRDTLLHEVIHAVERELRMRFTEKEVSRLATGLLDFMRANPQAVKYLVSEQ